MAFSIDVYRNMLRINKHRLDDELEVHAQMLDQIATAAAQANSRALEAKRTLEAQEAAVISRLKDMNDKMSNPIAEKEAKKDPKYVAAWQSWIVSRQQHEEWQGMLTAWQARGYQISTLANLYGMQYFAIDSTHSKGPSTAAAYERNRAEMRNRSAEKTEVSIIQRPVEMPDPPRRRNVV